MVLQKWPWSTKVLATVANDVGIHLTMVGFATISTSKASTTRSANRSRNLLRKLAHPRVQKSILYVAKFSAVVGAQFVRDSLQMVTTFALWVATKLANST